jgi:hypothetical protein
MASHRSTASRAVGNTVLVQNPHPDATPIRRGSEELLGVYFPVDAVEDEVNGVLDTLAGVGLTGPAFKLDQPRSSQMELAIELWLQREALDVLQKLTLRVATDLFKKLISYLSKRDASAQAIRVAWEESGGGSVVIGPKATAGQIRAAAEVIRAARADD